MDVFSVGRSYAAKADKPDKVSIASVHFITQLCTVRQEDRLVPIFINLDKRIANLCIESNCTVRIRFPYCIWPRKSLSSHKGLPHNFRENSGARISLFYMFMANPNLLQFSLLKAYIYTLSSSLDVMCYNNYIYTILSIPNLKILPMQTSIT